MCKNSWGGGGVYSLLWASEPLRTKSSIKAFAQMCVDAKVAGVFFSRTRDANLTCEILSLFKAAQIPVVLLGGDMPSGFPCDLAGINYLANGRRTRVNLLSPAAYNDSTLITHGELFGDVALRLMLQRLSYSSKHPSAEVYIDLPKPKAKRKFIK